MGKKRKEKKNSTPILMSKKLSRKEAQVLTSKKKKIKDKFKKIQDGGSYYIGALLFVPRKG